jgi:hypothetical protein
VASKSAKKDLWFTKTCPPFSDERSTNSAHASLIKGYCTLMSDSAQMDLENLPAKPLGFDLNGSHVVSA